MPKVELAHDITDVSSILINTLDGKSIALKRGEPVALVADWPAGLKATIERITDPVPEGDDED